MGADGSFMPFFYAPASVMPHLRRVSARRKESFQLKGLSWLVLG
jgi:hypothetical protein